MVGKIFLVLCATVHKMKNSQPNLVWPPDSWIRLLTKVHIDQGSGDPRMHYLSISHYSGRANQVEII